MSDGFHPVVLMPAWAEELDLTVPAAERVVPDHPWLIGRYDEVRVDVYTQDRYHDDPRNVHVGIDLGGPPGVAAHAFADAVVAYQGALPEPGDYGHAVVLRVEVDGETLWALYGHLSAASLGLHEPGDTVRAGEVVGWLGGPAENGGWPPHLHFQLSREDPGTFDMPGVVSEADRAEALVRYPDPRRFAI